MDSTGSLPVEHDADDITFGVQLLAVFTSHSVLLWNEVTWNPLAGRLAGALPRYSANGDDALSGSS